MESWRAGELESCRAVLLLYSTWQSKSVVFQHCLRTFLLCLSTFCVSFNTCCAHSYCIPALCACTFTIFKHFSGCIYTRLSFCGCIFYPLCVFPLCTLCSMAPNNVCTLCSIPHTLCAHCVHSSGTQYGEHHQPMIGTQ